ncbi:Major facilitator protein [Hibiscus syriacus]|uniref:Major facilitator protein n=1 Tax=Hibiscus syriacus TaxID=106335 RepID=A0A6A2YYN3_HIBSY|nr:Major facilitator protein [Hibiscus syriacus]
MCLLQAKVPVLEPGPEAHYMLTLSNSSDLRKTFSAYTRSGCMNIELVVKFDEEASSSSTVESTWLSQDQEDEDVVLLRYTCLLSGLSSGFVVVETPTSTINASIVSNKPKAFDEGINDKDEGNGKDAANMKSGARKTMKYADIKSSIRPQSSYIVDSHIYPATKKPDPMSMNVPDPDFHDFDQDRTESHLARTRMRMSWLNSKRNVKLAPVIWINSGFYKTSGPFWVGKYEVNRSLNSFSHKVKWSKGQKGTVQIYPRKGDVWALYRNWSTDWNELTPDEVIHRYDMVEVLEDYNEQTCVAVALLVKVSGFKTVFRKHSEQSKMQMIPKEELFQFSHQVPSYLLTDRDGRFELLFIAIGATIRSFITCMRPVIIVDGAHLKGRYLGVNLLAVAMDANNGILPIAYGVGKSETSDSWTWFMGHLRDCIGPISNLTIISDRANSIDNAVRRCFPDAFHGLCGVHLYRNLKSRSAGIKKHKWTYWKAVKAYREVDFNKHINCLRRVLPQCTQTLEDVGLKDGQEYINLEQDMITKRVVKSTSWRVEPCSNTLFQVLDNNLNGLVDLNAKTCSCMKWQTSGYPCGHVIKVALHLNQDDSSAYAMDCYTTEVYRQTYVEIVYPIPHPSEWDIPDDLQTVLPPAMDRRLPGRPKSHDRIPSKGEEKKRSTCSRCKESGHTRLTCGSPVPSKSSFPLPKYGSSSKSQLASPFGTVNLGQPFDLTNSCYSVVITIRHAFDYRNTEITIATRESQCEMKIPT